MIEIVLEIMQTPQNFSRKYENYDIYKMNLIKILDVLKTKYSIKDPVLFMETLFTMQFPNIGFSYYLGNLIIFIKN
jgi:hypothetical protein